MDLKQTLFSLSAAAGPSGADQGVWSAAAAAILPFVDSVERDAVGNLIARRASARADAPTILLDAHLDEVSLLVTDHEEGFLKFTDIGVDQRLLPGLRVRVLAEPPLFGVLSALPGHLPEAEDEDKAFPAEKLVIDCGLTAEEAARIRVGTRVVYATEPFALGEHRVCGKSMDDRACFVILCRVMELLHGKQLPVHVCVLGSAEEEYTGLGACAAAFGAAPEEAIIVDVSFAKSPDTDEEITAALGSGPMIGVGPVLARRMSDELQRLAREQQIPFTLEILSSWTGTNADDIQMSREGVAVSCVSLPLRYMHTPTEVADLRDLENCARLIAAYILSRGEAAPC